MVKSMDLEVLSKILGDKGPFLGNEEDEAACRKIAEELSLEDQEAAARASYAYWWKVTHLEGAQVQCDVDEKELRVRFAAREVRRHYIGENRDVEKARQYLKDALVIRTETKMDLVRWIPEHANLPDFLSDEEKETVRRYRNFVIEECNKQPTIVSGKTRDGLSISTRFPRTAPGAEEECYLISNIYIGERAFACTEYTTLGQAEKIIIVAEYADYISANSPGVTIISTLVSKLQRAYPERLGKLITFDPLYWMRILYNMVYPFLSAATCEKLVMVSGADAKLNSLNELVDVTKKSLPLLGDNGSFSPDEVNIEEYLDQPLFQIYGHAQ